MPFALLATFSVAAFIVFAEVGHSHVTRDHDPGKVWQSDVRVSVTGISEANGGGAITARFGIGADGDDPARSARLEILLPIGVAVVRIADECRPSPSPVAGLSARVTCELGDIKVKGTREIVISTSPRASSAPLRFAAFAFSDTPDPDPGNNFVERMLK